MCLGSGCVGVTTPVNGATEYGGIRGPTDVVHQKSETANVNQMYSSMAQNRDICQWISVSILFSGNGCRFENTTTFFFKVPERSVETES